MNRTTSLTASEILGPTLYYLVFLFVGTAIFTFLPDSRLWGQIDLTLFHAGPVPVTVFNVLHLAIGFPAYLYGSLAQRNAAYQRSDPERRAARGPGYLVTDGIYGQVRHPMYGMFMLTNMAMLFSLCSYYAMGLALLVMGIFYLNGITEEKTILIPHFEEQYRDYMKKVPARFFTPPVAFSVAVMILFSVVGYLLR